MSSAYKKYFGDRDFYRHTLEIAVPIMIQNGFSNFVGMLDNIMVGRVGAVEMTGVAIANTLFFVFNLMIFGAISGIGIFGAQYYGKNDIKGVRDTFRFKVLCCTVIALAGILFFYFFGGTLVHGYLQGDGDVTDLEGSFRYGMEYMRIMLIGLLPFAVSQIYASTLRETGETLLPMKAGIAAVLVNLLLNTVLIFGYCGFPKLGVAGAAIATVISRFVEAAIVMLATHRRKDRFRYIVGAYRSLKVPKSLAVEIIKKGLPLVMNETLWAGSLAMINRQYSLVSYYAVSAANISSAIVNVFNVSFIAMGNAIGIIVGQKLGAGDNEGAVDSQRKLTVLSLILCIFFGGALAGVSGVFPLIYKTSDNVRSMATTFIQISACCMPIGAYANASYFTLRSGGKTLITILFDSCYEWIIVVPTAILLTSFTSISIVNLYAVCQFVAIGKCIIGFFMVRSKIWIQNISV